MLALVVDALEKPLSLLLLRDVEPELEDDRALLREVPLVVDDRSITCLPESLGRLRRESLRLEKLRMNAHDEDFLVVAAVEDRDVAASREVRRRPPEKIVRDFDRRGRLERRDVQPARV